MPQHDSLEYKDQVQPKLGTAAAGIAPLSEDASAVGSTNAASAAVASFIPPDDWVPAVPLEAGHENDASGSSKTSVNTRRPNVTQRVLLCLLALLIATGATLAGICGLGGSSVCPFRSSGNAETAPEISTTESAVSTWSPLVGGSEVLRGDFTYAQYGRSVALSADGTVLAVGIHLCEGDERLSCVRVYTRTATTTWMQQGATIPLFVQAGVSVALSADGSILAVGTTNSNNETLQAYGWDGNTHTWNGAGDAVSRSAPQSFVQSIAVSADGTILAGVDLIGSGNSTRQSHVRVYQWRSVRWQPLGDAIAVVNSSSTVEVCTVALSASGRTLAVAAYTTGGDGVVRVYDWDTNTAVWAPHQHTIPAPWGTLAVHTPIAVSADGSTLAVSRLSTDLYDTNEVQVYRLDRGNGDSPEPVGPVLTGNGSGDRFGSSLSLSVDGSIIAVGAYQQFAVGNAPGYVQVFLWQDDALEWKQVGNDLVGRVADGVFGWAVALSSSADGTTVAVTAPQFISNGDAPASDARSGYAQVFSLVPAS